MNAIQSDETPTGRPPLPPMVISIRPWTVQLFPSRLSSLALPSIPLPFTRRLCPDHQDMHLCLVTAHSPLCKPPRSAHMDHGIPCNPPVLAGPPAPHVHRRYRLYHVVIAPASSTHARRKARELISPAQAVS